MTAGTPKFGDEIAQIRFGAGGNCEPYVVSGWSDAENGFRWSVGHRSEIRLPALAGGSVFATILLTANIARPGMMQRIAVEIDDTPAGEWTIDGWAMLTIEFPPGDAEMRMVFLHPDAAPPSDADSRELAFSFESITFRQGDAAIAVKDLMGRFISLGDNSEFGLVQRHYGAESIDLLRFSTSNIANVVDGIQSSFADIGDAAHFDLERAGDGRQEYVGRQHRYGIQYHTPIHADDVTPADVLKKRELARLKFLGRKLIEDIADAGRIFVFKQTRPNLRDDDALPLFWTLKAANPANSLLYVVTTDDASRVGEVQMMLPGLYKGMVSRFAPDDDAHDFVAEDWYLVCLESYQLWRSEDPNRQ